MKKLQSFFKYVLFDCQQEFADLRVCGNYAINSTAEFEKNMQVEQ